MCFVTIEDISSSIECIVFSRQYADRMQYLQAGNIILIDGRLSMREDKEPTVVCEIIEPNPKNLFKDDPKPQKKQRNGLFIKLSSKECMQMQKIDTLLDIFSGSFPVYAYYADEGKYVRIGAVNLNNPLIKEFKFLLGDENVVVRS